MPQEQLWSLLSKKLTGEASEEEALELDNLLKAHPEWIYAVQQVQQVWNARPVAGSNEESEQAFLAHVNYLESLGIDLPAQPENSNENDEKKKSGFLKRKFFAFALLFIIVALGFIWNDRIKTESPKKEQPSISEVFTRPGTKTKLVLADSSVVWLNAGSKLSYDNGFGHLNRNVVLTGEAFFDITKSSVPFIIHTSAIQIKVTGTAFNVKSYPNEKTTETSLIRGSVEITIQKRPGEKFILKPNEKLVVNNNQNNTEQNREQKKEALVMLSKIVPFANNPVPEISWVEDKLIFKDEPFSEVAKKMERWYGVTILFGTKELEQVHLTGIFEKETVSQALKALQISVPFSYTEKDQTIVITQ